MRGAAAAAAVWLVVINSARAGGPAIGQFELKDLEAGAGYLQFQSQNAYAWGNPQRGVAPGDPDEDEEALFDENTVVRRRHALEVEVGFSRYLKSRIGIEFEEERLDEPATLSQADDFADLALTEIGGEIIAIAIPRDGDGFGLGAVVEVEKPILSAEGEPSSVIMGPILEFASGSWSATVIPMAVHQFGGDAEESEDGGKEPRDEKWDFAYAAQLMYAFSDRYALALEGYGTVDRLGRTGHPTEANLRFGDFDQHRLGPILYVTLPLDGGAATAGEEAPTLTLGAGVLVGLNETTPDGTFKLSAEVDF
ncbi:MAG: hypothetical protein ACT4N2_11850 [Hyphomicrobium sp.]